MDQARRLKFGAIFFTIFWIGGMLWWSGEYHPAHIIILAVCGTIGRLSLVPRHALGVSAHASASAER